ncbi:MAG: biotin--[acetyl-CoA-carboxylase] ligase [Saprospirales bacterium]|nr:biotin--[acetyl-CoA-carboxylase] ligase [Saprospirales bacterium]MBK8491609.1 biotin--[acetyl-CoA-carboxylase] ligase [Saprospirales bacterium]
MTNLNTRFIGKVLLAFPELESTQAYAQELLSNSRPEEGTVIRTSYQTKGKGLLRNTWESEAGKNLLFTVLFYPTFLPLNRAFLLSQAMALGVRDWVSRHVAEHVQVKWPNDIYIGEKKVAGILIQNGLSGTRLVYTMVGIGININQTEFPAELPNPGSLTLATGKTFDLDLCLSELCWHLGYWYLQLQAGDWSAVHTDYLRQLYGYGELRTFGRPDGSQFQGRITGIAENGHLVIESGGKVFNFEMKEVRFI